MVTAKVKCGISVSVDNCAAGHHMTEEHPFGDMPENLLHHWQLDEPEKHKAEIDALLDAGAFIIGRNMFGPRGPEYDRNWHGWWGDDPPYHAPVFVLTHRAREPLEMKGGTTFYFVTDGIESALAQAREAANGRDIRLGGGVATVREYLRARLIDELHVAVRPVLLGSGEALFSGLDWRALGYECTKSVAGERAMHVFMSRRA